MPHDVHYAHHPVKSKRTPLSCFLHTMAFDDRPDEAKRLEQARIARGFKDAKAAASYFGWKYDTYAQHENGTRGITRAAAQYAKHFRVSKGWLLTGEGRGPGQTDGSDQDVPLLSMVAASNLRDQPGVTETDIIRRIKVGELPKGDWVALEVEGDSMNRIAPDGSIILVDRSDDKLLDGKFYVFSADGGAATFKMYRRADRDHPSRMVPYSTNPDHMAMAADRDDLYVFGRVKRIIQDV